ncbi:Proprotein convertase subtilisin/kexin type 7 [Balamuthia mandrillaris]
MPAWDKGYTGRGPLSFPLSPYYRFLTLLDYHIALKTKGVNIAIVDNGVNYNHPDLLDNYKLEGSWDFVGSDHDSTPGPSDDEHGTASAGIALAKKNNNICGVGVAPQAGLSAIRLISDKGNVDHIEAQALGYRCTPDDDSPFGFMNHIFSASWGPPDDGLTVFGADRLLREAMKHCLEHGRHGKGSIYLWSAGNGRAVRDNANYDGYANLRETIAIGAVDYLGYQAEYSESCACLMAVAPSSGRDKMVATDSLTSCTRVFGGTSAVSPMAAGVIALVLEANPYLYWRDVQQLIVQTSTSEGLDKRQWQTNGAGYRFHHGFGFGLLNAEAMVNAAKDFTSLSPAIMVWHRDQEPIPINKNALSVRKYTLTRAELNKQAGNGGRFVTEHVVVNVAGKYPGGFGGLKLTLISPHGTRSFLAEPHQDVGNVDLSWDFMTVANWGEDPVGDWTLEVSYLSYGRREPAPPYIRAWELDIYGHMVDSHVH